MGFEVLEHVSLSRSDWGDGKKVREVNNTNIIIDKGSTIIYHLLVNKIVMMVYKSNICKCSEYGVSVGKQVT